MMPASVDITQLRADLNYDPASGIFVWVEHGRVRQRAGRRAGCPTPDGYRKVYYRGKTYAEHRLAWYYVHGVWPVGFLDHRNGGRSDNRIENLRLATPAQNCANSRSHIKRVYPVAKGVTWNKKAGKWQASIGYMRKRIHLGVFAKVEDAAKAYGAAARRLYGEFARVDDSPAITAYPSQGAQA